MGSRSKGQGRSASRPGQKIRISDTVLQVDGRVAEGDFEPGWANDGTWSILRIPDSTSPK